MAESAPRVFIDSNVLVGGFFSPWSASRAILVMARVKLFRLVLSPYVQKEVECALLRRLDIDYEAGSRLIDDYELALQLLNPERLDGITKEEFIAHRHLIRHGNDVPVLATAIKAKPEWLVTANIERFDEDVALKTGLRIVTPHGFLQQIGIHLRLK